MLTESTSVEHINMAHAIPTLDTWHRYLGHINYSSIVKIAERQLATGMPTSLSYLLKICEQCLLAKQARVPVPKIREGGRAKRLLEKVFLDIMGPEDVQTPHGKLYTLNFIDD